MEIRAHLVWLKPDEHTAESIEEDVTDELRDSDSDALGECVRNTVIDVHPNRSKTDINHLTTDDSLHTIPDNRQQNAIKDGKICAVHSWTRMSSIFLYFLIQWTNPIHSWTRLDNPDGSLPLKGS